MPFVELVRTIRGRGSWWRWGLISQQLAIAVFMIGTWYGTFAHLPWVRLPRGPIDQHVPALGITLALLLAYIVLLPRLAWLLARSCGRRSREAALPSSQSDLVGDRPMSADRVPSPSRG